MWVSAFFGMMTNYAENYLGIRYRYKDQEGRWVGGAMVYMERGLDSRFLAVFFAVCCLVASLGMGNMVQGNSMAKGLETAFGIPSFMTGTICMILVAIVSVGGVKRVASLTEKLVPFMSGIYFLGALIVLAVNWQAVPGAVKMIFTQAFQLKAGAGGVAGYTLGQAVRMGIARGIFSNEAGLGSSVMAHAQADVKSPEIQGMWGILEVFIDTLVGCTMTALVILTSGVYQPELYLKQIKQTYRRNYLDWPGFCCCDSLGGTVSGCCCCSVCLCYHCRMVLFWRTDSGLPWKGKRSFCLSPYLYSAYPSWLYPGTQPDLGTIRRF